MNDLNSVLIEGELELDPVISEIDKGIKVCNLLVTSRRYYVKQDGSKATEVNDVTIQTWGRLAQTCADNLRAGRRVRVTGRIKQMRWNDKNGEAQSRLEIVADHVEFCPTIKAKEKQ